MKRKHLGSKFEDFLAEDGILEDCRASAIKFKIARELQAAFNRAQGAQGIPLREALMAVYDSFLENPLPMQIGLFFIRLERSFALARLAEVAGQRSMVAA